MVIDSTFRLPREHPAITGGQRALLHNLVPIALNAVNVQLEAFSSRLLEALFKLADQTVRTDEAAVGRNAYAQLKHDDALFRRAVAHRLNELLLQEINALVSIKNTKSKPAVLGEDADFALVSLEEMEDKVLIGNLSRTIETDHSALLTALNVRIGNVLQREEISLEQNPFRPALFLQAVYDAWCSCDPAVASHRVVLRLLRPEIFLQLAPILQDVNDALIARGIVPNLKTGYRNKKPANAGRRQNVGAAGDGALQNLLKNWLTSPQQPYPPESEISQSARSDLSPNADGAGGHWNHSLFGYLNGLQKQSFAAIDNSASHAVPRSADTLRQIKAQAPQGTLTVVDENTIELLAKIFDYVFREQTVANDIKRLIAQLQIPLLKAALIDKEFFFKEDHPARCLVESLAKSSLAWNQEKGHDDPLYKMIERIVERVQKEFDQQIDLFTELATDLDSFVEQEKKSTEKELEAPIAEAMRQERMAEAKQKAEQSIALRIETGEVAGFVESFLERQWTQVLTLAYSVQSTKPEAVENAVKGMDLLIWSVKPKSSPEERKGLIAKLPAMLSLINAWLNVVKWDGAERVKFFSQLAERHAALVRMPVELSPRFQFETAVTVAERASEYRFSRREKELRAPPSDQFVHLVAGMEIDDWLEFTRSNNEKVKYRLSWVSPKRGQFIFSNRLGSMPLTFSADELAQSLRAGRATLLPLEPIVDRALNGVLDQSSI